MLRETKILGVKITSSPEQEVLEYIGAELAKLKQKRKKMVIFTPNAEQLSAASHDAQLHTLLNEADIALPDGVGIVIAGKLLGRPIEARVAGVDFMKNLVKSVSKQPVNTGYFGGLPGVAEEAAKCLQKIAPKMTIGYASHAYDKKEMMRSDIDILFVALGFPKQEQWIVDHKDEIPASVIMAVGGSFDFISGRVRRAPQIFRHFGFEWLFRLLIQPWRLRRQLRLLDFSALILKEALGSRPKK